MSDDSAPRDCFGPPRTAVLVCCLHCREVYESLLIWFDERDGPETTDGRHGFWSCPTEGCGGIGFTCDIWPVDPEYRDEETGELLWVDDGWEEDFEGDAPPGDAPPGDAPPDEAPPDDAPPDPGAGPPPGDRRLDWDARPTVGDDEVPF